MLLTTNPLPVRLSPLVGREADVRDLVRTLGTSRLLTLTGPGGTGKTRLALAAANAAAVPARCWVELAPIDDPAILALAVAASLAVPETPGQDITDALAAHLADEHLLLVLDNCEHLVEAAAALAERLLAACPKLTVLATSREALGVDGERTWPVPPLSKDDAVSLFEQRARLVRPEFRVTDDNAAEVRLICQRLDGLPLAIELAAARVRMLSSAQLAERLDDMFAVLTGGARSAPPRHQALRATLDWSHDMLGEDERAAFRRLAVFTGGFTLDAAEHVVIDDQHIGRGAVLDLLTRLADKSLVRVDLATAATRHHLLVTIRDYAAEKLSGTADQEPARQAHLRYYVAYAEQAAARDDTELGRLDEELPNLRSAIEYAHRSGEAVAALRIACSLVRYASLRGHYHEVRQWLDTGITSCPDAPAELRAQALLGGGRLALLQCDYPPAVRRGEAALRLYTGLGDTRGIASGRQLLGSVAREQGRYARAAELYAQSLAGAEAAGDRRAAASVHGSLAFVSWLQLDFDGAAAAAAASLEISRSLGDIEGIASALIHLGIVARYRSDSQRSVALLSEACSLAEGIGFREGVAWTLEQLGLLAVERGDPDAVSLLRRSLDMHTELRDRWRMSSLLEDLAAVALGQGNGTRAARLLGAAEAIRDAIGTVIAPAERAQHTATVAGTRAAIGAEEFETARKHGLLATAEDLRADLPRAGARAADTMAVFPPGGSISPGGDPPVTPRPGGSLPPGPPWPPQAGETASVGSSGAGETGSVGSSGAGETASLRSSLAGGSSLPGGAAGAAGRAGGLLRIRGLGAAAVEVGDVALTAADWGYAKPRELLFLLASSPPVTRDQIGAALWPDLSGRQLGNALHTALRELRRAVGDAGWVQYADGHYRFDRSREHECDITAFEDALTAARRARPSSAGLPDLQRAVAAYGGDFLDGMSAGEWALVRRDELRRSYESALLASGRMLAAAGRHQAASAAFRRAVAHEPLNESAHRELMTCWAQLGESARAVRHYEQLAERLRDQLGVSPAAETTALYRKLISG
jgi:predicted ATPase/DNA-binding SARP family transcriptional activator